MGHETSRPQLTPEARDAIRDYIVKLVIPSAAVLTIVSGALGYVLSGLAKLEASATAAERANVAALKAAEAASDARSASLRASDAVKSAEASSKALESAKHKTDQLLTGQYDAFTQTLLGQSAFREALGKLGDQNFKDLSDKIDAWRGGILAAGIVRSGTLTARTDGVIFDPDSGRITFPNPKGFVFVPIMSAISPNAEYVTESCYMKSINETSFVLWQGAQDTSGRNHKPYDCTFIVVGIQGILAAAQR